MNMTKTLTLEAFEKNLINDGFTFEITKQTKQYTSYLISKDCYKMLFHAFNVLDNKNANYDLFIKNWEFEIKYKDKTGDDLI